MKNLKTQGSGFKGVAWAAAAAACLLVAHSALADEKASPISIKTTGRIAAGFLDGESGTPSSVAPPTGSFKIPDAKLRFDITAYKNIVVTLRGSFNNAAFNSLDYAFLDYNFKLGNNPARFRVGRHKVQIGDETFTDNPVEAPLIFNSAGIMNGYDQGFEFWTKAGTRTPVEFVADVMNGNKTGGGTAPAVDAAKSAKAYLARLQSQITREIYASGSYLQTGELGTQDSAVAIGMLTKAPASATTWKRNVWVAFARYDFQPGKKRNPAAYSDSKAFIRASYSGFKDDAQPTSSSRKGTTWMVDALWNLNTSWFVTARDSDVKLDNGVTASFNGVACNEYQRTQIGVGYRINAATNVKVERTLNKEKGGSGNVKDNIWGAVATVTF